MDDKNTPREVGVQIQGNPDALVPKYSTNALFSVNQNKMIISFLFADNKDMPPVVVQRIIIDLDHAQKIAEVIPKIIEKEAENE